MSVTADLTKALDALNPLKRKIIADEFDSIAKRHRRSSKGNSLDLEAFYTRVSSYRPGQWNSFHPLSPLLAASWGWTICHSPGGDETLLNCVSCRGTLNPSLPKRSIPSVFHRCANLLKEKIRRSHEEDGAHDKFCPWLVAHCPLIYQEIRLSSQLHQPPSVLREIFQEEWIRPLESLRGLKPKIPFIPRNHRPTTQQEILLTKVLKELYPRALEELSSREEASLLALRLVGWERKSESVMECRVCHREVGLWDLPSTEDTVSIQRDQREIEEENNNSKFIECESNKEDEHEKEEEEDSHDSSSGEESPPRYDSEVSSPEISDEGGESKSEEGSMESEEEEMSAEPASPEYSECSGEEERDNNSDVIEILSSGGEEEEEEREEKEVLREGDGDNSGDNSTASDRDESTPEPLLQLSSEEDEKEDTPPQDISSNESSNDLPTASKDESNQSIDVNEPSCASSKNEKESEAQDSLSPVQDSSKDLSHSPPPKEVSFFNPVSQHQPWCPWIAKGPLTGRSGYETIAFIIENKLKVAGRSEGGTPSIPSPAVHDKMKKMLSVLESIVN